MTYPPLNMLIKKINTDFKLMKRLIKFEELATMEEKIKFVFPNIKAEKRQNSY